MSEKKEKEDPFPAVPKSRFHEHVVSMDKSESSYDLQLMVLNQQLSQKKYTSQVYTPPEEVMVKNRYLNVLPSCDSRVKLREKDGVPGSDYINASFIKSSLPGAKTTFIATQAPVPDSFNDFWRMLWEHKVYIVIMLTREVERQRLKAHRYWPQSDEKGDKERYGDIVVTIKDVVSETNQFVERTFEMRWGSATREVVQIQYMAWPDHGTPLFPSVVPLWQLYRKKRDESPHGPVLIHCSAGIGRTGCFSAVDFILDNLADPENKDPQINVFRVVKEIRVQRPGAIQTVEQYAFVYRFVDYCLQNRLFGVSAD